MAKQKSPAPPAEYEMPEAWIGMPVLWRDCADFEATPHAGTVVGVGQRTVNIRVHPDGYHNDLAKSGVRHMTDPDRNAVTNSDAGAWEYDGGTRRLLAMEAALCQLRQDLGAK